MSIGSIKEALSGRTFGTARPRARYYDQLSLEDGHALLLRLGVVAGLIGAGIVGVVGLAGSGSDSADRSVDAAPAAVTIAKPVLLPVGLNERRAPIEASIFPFYRAPTVAAANTPAAPAVVATPTSPLLTVEVPVTIETPPPSPATTVIAKQPEALPDPVVAKLAEPADGVEPPPTKPALAEAVPAKPARAEAKPQRVAALETDTAPPVDGSAIRFRGSQLGGAVDGATLIYGGQKLRLAGIIAPALDATCPGKPGQRAWTCGTRARGALFRLVNGRDLVCTPQGEARAGMLTARCTVDGRDIAREQIAAGWARPAKGADDAAMAAEAQARDGKKGLWRNGWSINGATASAAQ